MRRAEIDRAARKLDPAKPELIGVMARAPNHEPTHAVADQGELEGCDRMRSNQLLEQERKVAPILGNVSPGVVANVVRRKTKVPLQLGAVGDRWIVEVRPACLGACHPMNENHDFRCRGRAGGAERLAAQWEGTY